MDFLNIPHLRKFHWSNNLGWIMVEYLHVIVIWSAKNMLGVAKYVAISYDKYMFLAFGAITK